MTGRYAEIAQEIAYAAAKEAAAVMEILTVAKRVGLSEPATGIAVDEARTRYDLLAEGHQIILKLSKGEQP